VFRIETPAAEVDDLRQQSNQTGNAVAKRLRDADFVNVGTACYEATEVPLGPLYEALRDAVAILEQPLARGRLDHLWIYMDSPRPRRSN